MPMCEWMYGAMYNNVRYTSKFPLWSPELGQVPNHSCPQWPEMSSGIQDSHTDLADVTQDLWEIHGLVNWSFWRSRMVIFVSLKLY